MASRVGWHRRDSIYALISHIPHSHTFLSVLHEAEPSPAITYKKYEKQNAEHRTHTLRLPDGHNPWTSRPDVKLWGMPRTWKRSRDVMDCVAAQALEKALDEALAKKTTDPP